MEKSENVKHKQKQKLSEWLFDDPKKEHLRHKYVWIVC